MAIQIQGVWCNEQGLSIAWDQIELWFAHVLFGTFDPQVVSSAMIMVAV